MLQSLKLRADTLNGIAATDAATATAATTTTIATAGAGVGAAVTTTLPTPVAVVNANGNVYNLTSNSSNNNNNNNNNSNFIEDNNNLNKIHQLHQYQGKYLETAAAAGGVATTGATTTATAKTFHPYLRPQAATVAVATTTSPPTLPTTLLQTLLHNQITTTAVAATTAGVAAATTPPSTGLLTLPTTAVTAVATIPLNSSINSKTSLVGSGSELSHNFKREIMSETDIVDDARDYLALVPTGAVCSISPDDNGNCSINAGDENAKDEPDPDNIKMFVGQIPKSWDEVQLRLMFELYGRVHTLNVLRDKVTSVSRGCCFVTYYTRKAALKAQDALHNIKTLEGMHHPIQMKPADSENRNERKLFVGMLNKKYNEADVRQLFSGHGTIEECTVLRDQNGQSKGCAFVTFATKQNAIGAIKSLHQSQTMEGCSAPLVVKFADTQKEKDQKKIQQLQASICGITALTTPSVATGSSLAGITSAGSVAANGLASATNALIPVRSQASISLSAPAVSVPTSASALSMGGTQSLLGASSAAQQTSAYLTQADAMNASASAQLQLFQQLQAFGLHPAQYLQGLNFPPDHSATTASLSSAVAATGGVVGTNSAAGSGLLAAPTISMQNLVTLAALNTHQHQHQHQQQSQQPQTSQPSYSHLVAQHQQQQQQHQQQHQHHHHQHQHQAVQQSPATVQAAVTAQAHHHAHMAQLMAAQQSAAAIAAAAQPMAAQYGTGATAATLWTSADSLTSPYGQALNPLTNGGGYATAPLTASALQAAAAGVAGKQIEGPEGSNLFIYHLPQEFTDTDLASTFLPFGNVLSAKVFIDKQTNLSKCFGFVSYDNPHSSSAAIQAMHGFQIGTKRLKVQLKRSKDAAKPY